MSGRASMPLSTIYRWPVLVAVVIALGLAAALSGEGAGRIFSWFALSAPVVLFAVCMLLALRGQPDK